MVSTPTIEPVFRDIRDKIATELRLAKHNIWIAVAWITDPFLFNIIEDKAKDGVNVELIIADIESQLLIAKNPNSVLPFHRLIEFGAKIFYMNSKYQQLMHHKFALLDGRTVITGSYNWTIMASKYNFENIVIIRNADAVAEEYAEEFKRLKKSINHSASLADWSKVLYIKNIKESNSTVEIELSDGWYGDDDKPLGKASIRKDSSSLQRHLTNKYFESNSAFYIAQNLSVAVKKNNFYPAQGEASSTNKFTIIGFSPPIVEVKVISTSYRSQEIAATVDEPEFSEIYWQNIIVSDGRNYGRIMLIPWIETIEVGSKLHGQFSTIPESTFDDKPTHCFVVTDEDIRPYQVLRN